jgi:hypothetical protein
MRSCFYLSLSALTGGEVSSRRRKGVELGAGDETVTRYPQTGDFITNVSARRGEEGGQLQTILLTASVSLP